MDTLYSSADGLKNTSDISGNGQEKEKETSQLILKLDENGTETEVSQIAKLIQALADKLIKVNKAEWRKIQIKDGRKGFALFFPASDWEIVNDELIELNSK